MSRRVRTFIREEMEVQQDLPEEERLDARHVILTKATELAGQGRISWSDDAAVTKMERAIERVDFDLLAGLEDRGAQTLLREVDQKDLVAALVGADAPVRERFLGNMSARVRGFLQSEMELSKAEPDYIEAVRQRILVQTGMLAAQGILQWPSGNGEVPALQGPQYEVPENLTALIARPLDQLTANDLADLWLGIANQARKEGILSLQATEEQTADPFLREALQLAVDGTEPDLLRDILETRLVRAILPQQETRCRMIIEAMMAIQSGDNPGIIRHKMCTFYLSDVMLSDDRSSEPTVDALAERLRRESVTQMSFDQITDLLTDLGLLGRNESINAFKTLPEALEGKRDMASEMLRRGLEMMLAGTEADQVMNTLETKVQTRLAGVEKAHRMVIEGVMGTQTGKKPEEIAEAVRRVAA
jgi:flagellar motor component MotA